MHQDKINDLLHLKGRYGRIEIKHNLYGEQVIRSKIDLFSTEDKIGLLIRGQAIYLNSNEIVDVIYSNNSANIIGNCMSIYISTK